MPFSLYIYIYTNLCRRADSRNAIKTGKRGLTFREISLLLSLSLSRVNLVRCIASSFLTNNLPSFLPFPLLPPPPPSPIIVHCFPFGKVGKVERPGQTFFFNFQFALRDTHARSGWKRGGRPVQLHGNESRKSVGRQARRVNFDDTGKGWLSNRRRVRETELN